MQGNWVGFRSSAAEDKFLQVKRKGLHRLAFHNAQFGTWEQWEIVQGQAHVPWEKLSLGFRNRRLPQVSHCSPPVAYSIAVKSHPVKLLILHLLNSEDKLLI